MDRADYFKKRGTTVDAKFARLHRRSIDQRTVRDKSYMVNRKIEECHFSPVKEDVARMPPPGALPKAGKKNNGAANRSMSKQTSQPKTAAASSKAAPPPSQAGGMSRKDKLIKWKEERELKKRQLANAAKKPQVFRVSKTLERKEECELYIGTVNNKKAAPKTAPAPTRTTRSSAHAPVKQVDPVPSKRRRGPVAAATTKAPSNRPLPPSKAPPTRQSARLAGRQSKPATTKAAKPSTRGGVKAAEKKATTRAVRKEEQPVEELSVIDESSINVTCDRGMPALTDTFAEKGFTFAMQLPDIPFTPISPRTANTFLFPTVESTTFNPSQRRCSTPYSTSLRSRKSLAKTPQQATKAEDEKLKEEMEVPVSMETNETEAKAETVDTKSLEVPVSMETTEAEAKVETDDTKSSETKMESEKSLTADPVESQETAMEVTATTQLKKDVPYFKSLVASETERLLAMCSLWEAVLTQHKLSEEVCGEIRSTIGKAKLLIDQRFKQFLGLIKNCEFGLGEKVTHCSDLEGFWEMIYFQVEDVDALFKDLEKLKANNWQSEKKKTDKPKLIKKKKPVSKKPSAAAAGRNAARERLLAAKAAMKAKATRGAEAEKVVFEGGFFKVESPAKNNIKEHCEAGSPFRTSRRNTPSRTATPKFTTTPKLLASKPQTPQTTATPVSSKTTPKTRSFTPTVAQLFSPMTEPRRSLRTKLCSEIDRLALSDKKATPATRRTPSRAAKESASASTTPRIPQATQPDRNKENEVDLSMYLQPCAPVVNLNEQAEELMLTEPEAQLEQLGVHSTKKSLRPRRSSVKPKDPFSPSAATHSALALQNSTNSLAFSLCSPQRMKTRKSSLGFGLSQAASLFTPTSTPEPDVEVAVDNLISFD